MGYFSVSESIVEVVMISETNTISGKKMYLRALNRKSHRYAETLTEVYVFIITTQQ